MGRSRREQSALAARLRRDGVHSSRIGQELRVRYGLNGRQAQRIAHGWTQEQAASAWSARWPEDPKTFKNVSYWETWPASTGHAPSL
ncbi:MAG: XRE family transcriptional regulator, partial [Actinomycetia bacterium]|nr:XRE family transcriptional regulator [Actinomycetes bacterium]